MLKRIDLAGGTARDISRVGGPWHGAFSGTGELLGLAQGILLRVPDQGGTPKAVEGADGDTFPTFLSDGKRFLVRSITKKGSAIQLATLGSEPRTLVLDNVLSAPVFAPTPSGKSYLLFLRDADLMAQEFDEGRGAVVGEAVVLVRRIGRVANPEVMPAVGVSRSGILAYQSADAAPLGQLSWLDRSGVPVSTLPTELAVLNPRLSPDGSFIVGERPSGGRDIWVANLKRESATKVTVDETLDSSALWSPDGNRVAFSSAEKGILAVDATGGSPTMLTEVAGNPSSWSPDGNYLLYNYQGKLFLLEIATKKTTVVGAANGASSNGMFSPDGKYIAYNSAESGRGEVYVQPMPPGTGRTQVSVKGGTQPRWSGNGREIFFLSPKDMMMVADVTTGQTVSAGVPRELFKFTGFKTSFDVSRDGQRFLVLTPPKEIDAPITVVLNWWLGLERTPR
jgi:dipeptidyl aminopeptidase/acylaminoacyl peptidase